jgi:hypothetical protein
MDTLQRALKKALRSLPRLFLGNVISEKLRHQGITAPKRLPEKLARHILSGTGEPFRYRGGTKTQVIRLAFNEDDADEITHKLDEFCETKLPILIPQLASRISDMLLKDLEARWMNEQKLQETEVAEFRKRLEQRWGKALGQLRLLLTICREWGQETHNRRNVPRSAKKKLLREIQFRLFARACQVTGEIICLLENGYADGAMARWRTLHEICVVTTVISRYGESIAERYVAHQAVESNRAMNKYLSCCGLLGYRPLATRDIKRITKAYDAAILNYGKDFGGDYGWAALHLKKKRVTFADLEAEAGRSEMRSHYQLGNDNIHAGVKSMFVRLGLLDDYSGLLSGRSNAGLIEPGQNAAISLTQIAALVCLPAKFDDLVIGQMLHLLKHEIPRSFYLADQRLRRDDRKYKNLDS